MRTDRSLPTDPTHPARPAPSRSATATSARFVRSMRRVRLERRTLLVMGAAVLGLWLLVVFANALADASEQTARLRQEETVNASLEARAAAGAAEIERIADSVFREFIARSYGWGLPAERLFALAPGAPPPPSMVPLGQAPVTATARSPLDDWLDLLVGS